MYNNTIFVHQYYYVHSGIHIVHLGMHLIFIKTYLKHTIYIYIKTPVMETVGIDTVHRTYTSNAIYTHILLMLVPCTCTLINLQCKPLHANSLLHIYV